MSTAGKKTKVLARRPKRPIAVSILNKDMVDLIDICMKDDINEVVVGIMEDHDKYKLFLRTVLFNVIRKQRWKENYRSKPYYDFITPSDEAFGILALDNSGDRYICMALNMKNSDMMCIPKYTAVNGEKKMRQTDRGWDGFGQRRYFKLEEKIVEWRENNENAMKDLDKVLKKDYGVKDEDVVGIEDFEMNKRHLEEEEAHNDALEMFKKKLKRMVQV